ncbi:hypothetical protein TNIN_284111 [Trichonephila inaurata madagascariensis]|uniref:Uncharacterized protein n=1 Tax=Trichonephila inaurata madagascariensis TaxID=2747483 RepID=A0A8X7BNM4_9ARAC|nr:hypothetical protein TNIN_284111 [Trichonephila inaurata madagascariensis]
MWVLFGSGRVRIAKKNNYSRNFVPLFYLTPSMGHFIKEENIKMVQDYNSSSSRLPSSDHVFLAFRFLANTLLFFLVPSPLVWSPLSLPGPPLYIVGSLPDLVCIVRPLARCKQ